MLPLFLYKIFLCEVKINCYLNDGILKNAKIYSFIWKILITTNLILIL
jgi:hypothetical protein